MRLNKQVLLLQHLWWLLCLGRVQSSDILQSLNLFQREYLANGLLGHLAPPLYRVLVHVLVDHHLGVVQLLLLLGLDALDRVRLVLVKPRWVRLTEVLVVKLLL